LHRNPKVDCLGVWNHIGLSNEHGFIDGSEFPGKHARHRSVLWRRGDLNLRINYNTKGQIDPFRFHSESSGKNWESRDRGNPNPNPNPTNGQSQKNMWQFCEFWHKRCPVFCCYDGGDIVSSLRSRCRFGKWTFQVVSCEWRYPDLPKVHFLRSWFSQFRPIVIWCSSLSQFLQWSRESDELQMCTCSIPFPCWCIVKKSSEWLQLMSLISCFTGRCNLRRTQAAHNHQNDLRCLWRRPSRFSEIWPHHQG
jgi:hypothetical protein